jgi:glycosyltransferase involved in cell wall biosynthesis
VSKNTQKDFKKLFNQDSAVIYEAAGLDYKPIAKPTANYFLAQGTREPRKNLTTVLLAFERFYQKHPNISLKIAGKYGWGQDIKPTNGVEVLGYVSDQQLLSLHQNALALVYPSLYEGFGLPILKSLGCGVPVITSNTSSLPEVTGSGGILVDPTSPENIRLAMESMLKPTLYQKLKKGAVSQAKKFSWSQTAQATLNLYQNIYDHRN